MHRNALAEFLIPWVIPPGSDEWQIAIRFCFAGLLFGLTMITIFFNVRDAKETSWEKNWKGIAQAGKVAAQLDIGHGSVNDISLAIRTRSEAMASTMPGVLLVIGLLGTFIGLGLALTEASVAFTADKNLDTAGNATADIVASEAVINMMKGLGYKFATSTWGIVAYLILQAYSALHGFDRKRLRFAAGKMRKQLDEVRHERRRIMLADREHYTELIERIAKSVRATSESSAGTLAMLGSFLDGMKQNIDKMSTSSASMAQSAHSVSASADRLGDSATSLQHTVGRFDDGVRTTLDDVKSELGQAIADLSSTTTQSMDRIASDLREVTSRLSDTLENIQGNLTTTLKSIEIRTAESNTEIANSLLGLSTSVDQTLSQLHAAMAQAAEVNQKAHRNFEASTTRILVLMSSTEQMVNSIKQDILNSLAEVANGNVETRKLCLHFESIVERNDIATVALVNALSTLQVPRSVSEPHAHGSKPSRADRRRKPR